ncbi:MAG: hypothetical protein CL610_18300 [Anaerolineaceae bacterium]|nr:hypothetical protein [Anaerolineaceae bacterium]
MSHTFLLNLMRVTHDVTRAERAFAVDLELNILGTLNITPEQVEAPYLACIRQALAEGTPIITDNYTMSIDPSKAPVTNKSFPKLRFVVILPVKDVGAVCLDQNLRGGVTTKDKVERLTQFIQHVLDNNKTELDEDELSALYQSF